MRFLNTENRLKFNVLAWVRSLLWVGIIACVFPATATATANENVMVNSSAASTPSQQATSCEAADETLDPKLDRSFLLDRKNEKNNPKLVVGKYSKAEGMVVGYQSNRGKRIMFSAKFPDAGGVYAQVLHFDPIKQKVVPVFHKSKRAYETGEKVRDINVGDVDILAFMKGEMGQSRGDEHANNLRKLVEFLDSDIGDALAEATPALYARLDSMESVEQEIAKLKAPFGAVAMALQLSTKRFTGFEYADKVLGSARTKNMRDACAGDASCQFRGKGYIVHNYGLFDALSKHKGLPDLNRDGAAPAVKGSTGCGSGFSKLNYREPTISQSFAPGTVKPSLARLLTDPVTCILTEPCFGMCGPLCFNPGNIETPACLGHDMCSCQFGHLSCVFSTPAGCGAGTSVTCASLYSAVFSWLDGLLGIANEFLQTLIDYLADYDDDGCLSDPLCDSNSP
jgi:hypothetical protein